MTSVVHDCAQWDHAAIRLNGSTSADNATTSAASGAGAAGLVPSKTNRQTISFAPSVVAERRVKRLKKSVWASGHLHGIADNGSRPPVVWFVTLTYRGVADWSSKHMSKAMEGYRHWCRDRGVACRYTWVAELQSRGAVHYHLLAWLPHGVRMPLWDRRTVTTKGKPSVCFWPYGMTNRQVAKAGVGYLMKYLSKLGELTRFPKGLRLYGVGGLNVQGRGVRSWLNLPEWVKASYGVGEIKRVVRGFCERATGLILEPMFRVHHFPDGISLERLRPAPERFHDGAYSTVSFA